MNSQGATLSFFGSVFTSSSNEKLSFFSKHKLKMVRNLPKNILKKTVYHPTLVSLRKYSHPSRGLKLECQRIASMTSGVAFCVEFQWGESVNFRLLLAASWESWRRNLGEIY